MTSKTISGTQQFLIGGFAQLAAISLIYIVVDGSKLDGYSLATLVEISGPRYITAALMGLVAAHIAALVFAEQSSAFKLESWVYYASATLLAVLAVSLHFGVVYAVPALLLMAAVTILGTKASLPQFFRNASLGMTWGICIGALIYLKMSTVNPVALTQLLTADLSGVSPIRAIAFMMLAIGFMVADRNLAAKLELSNQQLAGLWFLALVAFGGIVPFIVSIAILLKAKFGNGVASYFHYIVMAWLCLVFEAFGRGALAGYNLPLGLSLAGFMLPIFMMLSIDQESGLRKVLNIAGILVVAVALWLTLFINFVTFKPFVV